MKSPTNWSAEQLAIFDYYRNGSGHLVVEAFAGTGKTTTIKEAFSHAPEGRILYAVFNKRNQKEAAQKITDQRVEVKTLHAVGFKIIKGWWSNAKPDNSVEADRCMKAIGRDDKEMIGRLAKVVSFAKNTLLKASETSIANMVQGMAELNIDERDVNTFAQLAVKVLEASRVKPRDGLISFDDMVWLPVEMGWLRATYDLVTVDEAQDMNLPQLTMARGVCKGRMVVVGDSRQAIYGFRGAVQNGMGMMKLTLRAQTLNLTTTYRCPKSVVEEAAKIVPNYKAAPEAPQGLVSYVPSADSAKPGDAILSRLNAPLMPLALSFLRRNIPARIEGRDIGRQLIGMIKSFKAKSVPDLISKISAWEAKQVARLDGTKFAEKKIEQVQDIAQTLQALALDAKSVTDVEQKINGLFEDTDESSKPAVTLSSVHKAKGLEWHRVFLLSSTFRQSKGGEEANIYYVALTRSKSELFLVGATGSKQEEQKSKQAIQLPAPASSSCSTLKQQKTAGEAITGQEKATKSALPPPRALKSQPALEVGAIGSRMMHAVKVSLAGVEDYDKQLDADPICKSDVFSQLGEVMIYSGSEYVCVRVSESAATWRCKTRKKVSYECTRTGGMVEFETSAKGELRLSPSRPINETRLRLSKEEFQNFLSGKAHAGSQNNTGEQQTNKMKTPKTKTESKVKNTLAFIVGLAKSGSTEAKITQAVTKEFGEPSPATAYIIGREWRRVNKVGRHFGDSAAPAKKAPAKKPAPAAKAPAKKVAPKAPAPKKAPVAPKAKSVTPPPPKRVVVPTDAAPETLAE